MSYNGPLELYKRLRIMSHQLKYNRLKRRKRRNIVLNIVCILIAGSGLAWTANYFWRYINYEITNDAFVDQYIAPINIHTCGRVYSGNSFSRTSICECG